jgi:hypothetical protein
MLCTFSLFSKIERNNPDILPTKKSVPDFSEERHSHPSLGIAFQNPV